MGLSINSYSFFIAILGLYMAFYQSDYSFIVSLDFGNSFSGTCCAITPRLSSKQSRASEYPEFLHVNNWPEQYEFQRKTPSIIAYDRNLHLLHWGMTAFNLRKNGQLKDDQRIVEKFKFGLPTSIAQKGAFRPAGNTSINQLINMRAAIDFFREIMDHTVANLLNDEKENIRFVITVPEQWNDAQKSLMRFVAIEAGLISEDDFEQRLLIINESLAALLYCERNTNIDGKKYNDNKNEFMLKNDKYMICDAGGATVSIAVFEAAQHNNDNFRRCQLTAGIEYNCGSAFLDLKIKEALLNICFGADKEAWKDNKSKKEALELLITPLVEQFRLSKTNFGKAKKDFIPDCCYEIQEMYDSYNSDKDDDGPVVRGIPDCKACDFTNGHDEQFVELDNFGDDTFFVITQGKILDQLKLQKVLVDGVKVEVDDTQCTIRLSYKFMRENVFNQIVKDTLSLLRRQLKKANGGIKRTYMVGGFGGSPYLQKRIMKEFSSGSPYDIGDLVVNDIGDSATMRGALINGIDERRKTPQSDIVVDLYTTNYIGKYNVFICLDIGYNGTACSYRDLRKCGDKMTEIINWPGLNDERFIIPTAKETLDGKTLWGAQVRESANRKPESFVVPSKLMSALKGSFNKYLIEFLKAVFEHIHSVITEGDLDLSEKSRCRYVITMENCYHFFNSKQEMRKIALLAGIINETDSFDRLLLIRRSDAAAIHFETTEYSGEKARNNLFLQINLYHDTCHLSLHESTRITGYDDIKESNNENSDISTSNRLRNVRSIRSATFGFDFIATLVTNLSSFIFNLFCCEDQKSHNRTNVAYILELRRNFLEYVKGKLDFNSNEAQTIQVTKSPGCQISITKYEVLEYVFRPAIRELASAIKQNGMQRNVFSLFNIHRIFLSGFLIETKKETYDFLEKIVLRTLSGILEIPRSRICSSAVNGKEALLGAAYYGNHPEQFTERVSRGSYAVQVRGYKCQEFEMDVKKNISGIELKGGKDMKSDIYNEEAANAFIDESKPVQLYYQASYNQSLEDNSSSISPGKVMLFIRRGDKISAHNEMHGVAKRFYAKEECVVYVAIYSSENSTSPKSNSNVDLTKFDKIHQFELYIKRDKDDPTTTDPGSRLYFDVCLKFDKEEFRFEALPCSKLGHRIPEFRSRDEYLVANIYGDRDRIKIGNIEIVPDVANVLQVADS